jgi:localization factor PodJL
MIRASAWAGADAERESERRGARCVEPRVNTADPAVDFDSRLLRMESVLNSLLDAVQTPASVEKLPEPPRGIPRQSRSGSITELGRRPKVSDHEDWRSTRFGQRQPEARQGQRHGVNSPPPGEDKITAFAANQFDNIRARRPHDEGESRAGFDELQDEIADVSHSLLDLGSQESIASLGHAIRGLAQTVEDLRSESVSETALQPLDRLVRELKHSLAQIEPPNRAASERGMVGLRADTGKSKLDYNLFRSIEEKTNKLRDLLDKAGGQENAAETFQRPHRAENSYGQRPAAGTRSASRDDERVPATIEERLEVIAANIEETIAQSHDSGRYDALSERIDEVRRELTARIANAWLAPDTKPLEDLLHNISQKLENAQNSQPAKQAIEALERRVTDLSEQFERANAQLPSLASVEAVVSDLFAELERTREAVLDVAERAARNVLNRASAEGTLGSEISQEIQSLRAFQDEADRRMLSTLATIHDVLAKLVDRLAVVEEGMSQQDNSQHGNFSTNAVPVLEPERFAELRGTRSDLTGAARRAAQAATAEIARRQTGDLDLEPAGLFRRFRDAVAPHKRSIVFSLAAGFIGLGAYALIAMWAGQSVNFLSDIRSIGMESASRGPLPLQASMPPPQYAPEVVAAVAVPPQNPAPPTVGDAAPSQGSAQFAAAESPSQTSGAARDSASANETAVPPSASGPGQMQPAAEQPALETASAKWRRLSEDDQRSLKVAAENGDAQAQFKLAAYYARSHNLAAALRLYQRAAEQGLPPAEFRLAYLYQNGLGVARDLNQARAWYLKAAEQGNVKAMYNVAVLAANGKPDYITAARWFKSAAEYGLRNSQYNFAVLLARGLGVQQDLVASYSWFAIAAAQGDQGAAEKRDEVGAKLNSNQLAAANVMATSFHSDKPDPSANEDQLAAIESFTNLTPGHDSGSSAN